MLSPLRNRFGIPGAISVVALVFAMLGGAYAANDSGDGKATASAKAKRGPKGPKGATGPAGPAGPAGPQGVAGANGKDGTNGSNGSSGSDGTDGQSVTVTEEPAFGECGDQSGYKLDSISGEAYVCNGANGEDGVDGEDGEDGVDGEPWTAGGTLPVGETLAGTWGFSTNVAGSADFGKKFEQTGFYIETVPLSFNIPLASPLDENHVVFVKDNNTEHCSAAPINGSMGEPKAESGYLCIYTGGGTLQGTLTPSEVVFPAGGPTGNAGSSRMGTLLFFDITEDTIAYGSWAVTG